MLLLVTTGWQIRILVQKCGTFFKVVSQRSHIYLQTFMAISTDLDSHLPTSSAIQLIQSYKVYNEKHPTLRCGFYGNFLADCLRNTNIFPMPKVGFILSHILLSRRYFLQALMNDNSVYFYFLPPPSFISPENLWTSQGVQCHWDPYPYFMWIYFSKIKVNMAYLWKGV